LTQVLVSRFYAHEALRPRSDWLIVHPMAELPLLRRNADEIVLLRELDGIVLRIIRLQDHFSRRRSASCAARNLGEQLECALRSAKVGTAQREVRPHASHKR